MMTTPAMLTPDEPFRLQALRRLNVMDTPLEERFERITRMAKRLLGTSVSAISLIEADRQWFKSIQGCDLTQTGRDESFCGHAIMHDDLFIVDDARVDPRFKDNPLVTGHPHIVFYAGCPVCAEDGARVGMLCVIDSEPRTLNEEEADILRDLAGLAESEIRAATAAAVQASLIEEVSAECRRGMIDELTRLWNRAGVMDLAQRAHQAATKDSTEYALVMIDLDDLKPVNDTLGHHAGDEALRLVAKRMLGAIRESDTIGRIGGDEFLLILSPCASEADALAIVERVRDRLASQPIRTRAGEVHLHASFGVRFVTAGDDADLRSAIEDADRAMYAAKDAGGNRVSGASLLPAA